MKFAKLIICFSILLLMACQTAIADPIKRIEGTIVDFDDRYLWIVPDGQNDPVRFIMRWKVRFQPPRLPIKGDHVVLLYKNKDEGRIIYGVDYLKMSTDVLSYD